MELTIPNTKATTIINTNAVINTNNNSNDVANAIMDAAMVGINSINHVNGDDWQHRRHYQWQYQC